MLYLDAIAKMTEWSLFVVWFCEDLQDSLELTLKKDVLFIIGDQNAKVGSQELTGKFGLGVQNEADERLTEFFQNTLFIANTLFQQRMRRVYTGTSSDGQYLKQIDYILFASKDGEALYKSAKTRLGADCGSDHELLMAKFRLKLKKVRKTTRSFRHDLNQISYNYIGKWWIDSRD